MELVVTGKIRNATGDQREVVVRFDRPLTDDEIQRMRVVIAPTHDSEAVDPYGAGYDHPYDMSTNPPKNQQPIAAGDPADASTQIKPGDKDNIVGESQTIEIK